MDMVPNIVKDKIKSKVRQHAKRAIKHVVPKSLVPPALRGEGLTEELMRYMPESALQYVPQHLRHAINSRGGFQGSGPGYKFSD